MRKKEPSKFNRIVLNQLGEVKGNLFVAAVCMICYTLTELLAPWPFKIIFDHILLVEPLPSSLSFLKGIFQRGEIFSLVIFSLSIFLIAICKGLFSYLQIYMTSRIGYQVVDTLRRELFGHLQRLSLSFHNRARSGELLTKVTSDTNILKDVFAGSALTFTSHLFTIIGMFAIMLAMNWKLTLIVLATLPVLSYALFYLYGKIKASAQTQRRKEGKVASRLNEILASVSLVQAFGREKYEKERFETESAETFEESIRTARMEAATTRTVEIVSAVGVCAVVFFGSFQALQGRMTPGEVLVFIAYLNNMYKPIRNLARLSAKFVRAKVSAERVSEILEIEPEIQDRPDAVEASDLKGEIVFKEVSFDYGGGRDVLRKVSFSILPGQKVALVGASGAGKSTIVNLILRLYDPQGGAILIDGIDIKRYRRESLRREIGIVLQDSILFGATVKENISYGKPQATQEEIEAAARRAHAHDFITSLPEGYDTVLGERGSTLSGGQRQRISLARALIKEPSILVLDEPTSAVDAESATLIQDALINFQKGRTILVIVHQFSAIKHVDQIFVIKDGEVVEQGTHDALLEQKGHYHQLFEFQLR
ncbi:ABC transporter ATP-binding protein [Candidatus Manganitrophus noduliformans]|uniref:ABC transporter ATP-binding protein n=1 Tax=Candidatus Manganitrophus noduliformans TaxID=2606439 RepID=A0A7X6IAY1_9BACT|nr:ABC transporter ATP-binding protein [Candidatus Manganitrophus noduliformans]NKE70870.1 ABC transporter ATP-binding protein [Candidatus Manganitrophus noduliformans]